jgi:formylmethanofuran dehydrogenase subunit B
MENDVEKIIGGRTTSECTLNTGRTIEQGVALELGKTSQDYYQAVATASIDEREMEELGLEENGAVRISTDLGSVVVRCRKTRLDPGQVFIPSGPWANALISPETSGTGMPRYKGVKVQVSRTEENLTTLGDLLAGKERMARDLTDIPRYSVPRRHRSGQSESENETCGQNRMTDVVCPFCGCLCDDVEIVLDEGRISRAIVGCRLSRSRFMNSDKDRIKPATRKAGRFVEVTLKEAVERAAEILKEADYPLIYGLSSTETGAQRRAVELAEVLGATIDATTSVCHGPTFLAAQNCGVPKMTLGEVRNRADLVVYWGCNPAEAHIRHKTRYATSPRGLFVSNGTQGRVVVHIDVRETKNAKAKAAPGAHSPGHHGDMTITVRAGQDYELISALRARLKGHHVGDTAGVPTRAIDELVERMKTCKSGVLFFGLGLTMSRGRHMNIDNVLRLVRDLNDHTKFTILPMRGHYNVAGATQVMSWLTGYPFAVNFSRGHPVYNPGEFTAADLLARRECDAALIVASDPLAHLPARAARHLSNIPTIVIDPKISMTSLIAEVLIPAAIAGIECDGTAYRMDDVPLRLRKVVESEFQPDRVILERILEEVRA